MPLFTDAVALTLAVLAKCDVRLHYTKGEAPIDIAKLPFVEIDSAAISSTRSQMYSPISALLSKTRRLRASAPLARNSRAPPPAPPGCRACRRLWKQRASGFSGAIIERQHHTENRNTDDVSHRECTRSWSVGHTKALGVRNCQQHYEAVQCHPVIVTGTRT